MADPSERWGVKVRSFSDARIEAIHGQIREAETVQALARLRLVHSPKRKAVFLLGNLPVEMPVDRLVEWNQLMPDKAERALLEKGNIALSPTGIVRTRPDLVATEDQAKDFVKRTRVSNTGRVYADGIPRSSTWCGGRIVPDNARWKAIWSHS